MMYENPDARETPGLEDYLAALRSRWLLVLLVTVFFTVAGYLYVETRTVVLEARAEVLVNPTPVGRENRNGLARVSLERERGVFASVRTAERASEIMGLGEAPSAVLRDLTVEFEPDSDILVVFVKRTDADLAKDTANAMAEAYVQLRNGGADEVDAAFVMALDDELAILLEREAELLDERDDLNRRIALLDEPPRALTQRVDELNNELSRITSVGGNISSEKADAEREQNTRSDAAEVLRLEEISDFSGIGDRTVYLGAFLAGLILGMSGAWVLDRLDRTARESDDVELAVGSKVLGSVPDFGVGNRSGTAAVVMLGTGRSHKVQRAREAFRRLRSSVQFVAASGGMQSYVITSARPSEGKSVTITNLAVAMAQSGASVVLVSADMRRPMVEKLLGLGNPEYGLSGYLAGNDRADIALRVESAPNLTVVPSGPLPANPGELLSSPRFGSFISDLKTQFDFVFVDAPPVLSAADSLAAAVHCDGVIVVVDSQNTDTDALLRVSSEIRRAGGTVAGAVLNKDKSDSNGIFGRDRYAYEKVSAQV